MICCTANRKFAMFSPTAVTLELVLILAVGVGAETYYDNYLLANWDKPIIVSSYNECINQCASSATCIAVSICYYDGFVNPYSCATSFCGNIVLRNASNCRTVVFDSTTLSGKAPVNLTVGVWYSIAISFSFSHQVVVYANRIILLTANFTGCLLNETNSNLTIYSGVSANSLSQPTTGVSIFCFKVFSKLLTDVNIQSIESSCTIGKINFIEFNLNRAGYAMYTENGNFAVPDGVRLLKVLAVGGGAGGSTGNTGGGGSGYVDYAQVRVSRNQSFPVIVGVAGKGAHSRNFISLDCNGQTDGGNSSFGSIVVAQGGKLTCVNHGGAGGSGGGAGTFYLENELSGDGGSAGTSGKGTNFTVFKGGAGQGYSFTSSFSHFRLTNISAGKGAAGKQSVDPIRYGGGGAGGVLFNNTGPSSGGAIGCLLGTHVGPSGATGYGAGGSGGCRDSTSSYSAGGVGAGGVVYVEYFY